MIQFIFSAASTAWAADAPAAAQGGGGSAVMQFLPIIAIFAIMYFLLIRPQSKKAKLHQNMLKSIQKGDKVLMNGGMFGKVSGIDDKTGEMTLEIAPQVRVKVSRGHVANVVRGNAPVAPQVESKKEESKKEDK